MRLFKINVPHHNTSMGPPAWLTRVPAGDLGSRVPCICYALEPGTEGVLPQLECMGSSGVVVIQSSTAPRARRVVLTSQNLASDGAWHCRKLLTEARTTSRAVRFAELVAAHQSVEPGAKWHEWATLFDEFRHFGDYDRSAKATFINGLERHADNHEVRTVLNIFDPPDTLKSRGRIAMGPATLARHKCALKPAVFCKNQEWFVRWQLVGDLVLMYGNDGAQTIRCIDDDKPEADEARKRRECDDMVGVEVKPAKSSSQFTLRMDEHLFLSLRSRQKMWHQKRKQAYLMLVEDAQREDESTHRKFFVESLKQVVNTPVQFGHAVQLYDAGDKTVCADAAAAADAAFKKYVKDGRLDMSPLDCLVHTICDAIELKKNIEHCALLDTVKEIDFPACQGLSKAHALDHTYETRKRIFCTRTHLEKEGYSQLRHTLERLLESFYSTKEGHPWPDRKKQVLAPMKTLYRAPSCATCPFGYATPDQCLVGDADFTRVYTPADVIIENAQARKTIKAEEDDDAETDALMGSMSLDQNSCA